MFNRLKTLILLGALSGLMLGAGLLLGGRSGLTIALVIALVMNFISYFFSSKIVLMMYHAKEVKKNTHPKLFAIVSEVAKKAKVPMPKVYIIPTQSPNAFATGRNPKNAVVAATEGILSLLNDEELKGVIAHEMSHIKNRDILIQTIAVTIATAISYVAQMAQWAAIFGGSRDDDNGGSNIFTILALAIITPIVATLIQLAISRSREYLADESAAKILNNGRGLASALHKLENGIAQKPMRGTPQTTSSLFIANPFSMKGMFSLLSTHPPIDERIKKLNAMKF